MRVVNRAEMNAIEESSKRDFSLSESMVIQQVGIEVADILEKDYIDQRKLTHGIFLIGKGNNGADGVSAARNLFNNTNAQVTLFFFYPLQQCSQELIEQCKIAKAFGLRVIELLSVESFTTYLSQLSHEKIFFIDALFGMGVRLPLAHNMYQLISFINDQHCPVISIDIPSGVDGNLGSTVGNAIKAHKTIAIGAPKLGCFLGEGAKHTGELCHISGGFPKNFFHEGDKFQIELSQISSLLHKRAKFSDKRSHGHTLVIGGSSGLTGALVLASQAALVSGSGLVTGVTWEEQHLEYLCRQIPEIMSATIPKDESLWSGFIEHLSKFHAVVIGPGLGRSKQSRTLVLRILSDFQGPVVIDADAIAVIDLKEDAGIFANRNYPCVLTPHLGEFNRLLSQKNSSGLAVLTELTETVSKLSSAVVLKGPSTVVGMPLGQTFFNFSPNAGMATGGTGDILAGILGAILAQEFAQAQELGIQLDRTDRFVLLEKSILLGLLLHTRAGHHAVQKGGVRGMIASTLLEYLPTAFKELETIAESDL